MENVRLLVGCSRLLISYTTYSLDPAAFFSMRNLRMRGLLNMGFDKRQKPNHLAISPYEIPLWAMTRTPYSCNGNYAYVNEFPVLVYGLQLVCYKWQYVLLGWKKFG